MPGVLFVCTGNICRSPMAEAIGRKIAGDRGLAIMFDSAGVSAEEHGNPPDPRACRELERRGYAVPERVARQVRPDDFRAFGWIIAMTREHKAALRQRAPIDATTEIALFSRFLVDPDDVDIADPWYGGGADFVAVMDLLEDGMPRLIDAVLQA
ncbi:MAG: low molecular weight protein-tyrosine-phosphatase [Pseudomonadota bacterium]